jgi:hypothetical protein
METSPTADRSSRSRNISQLQAVAEDVKERKAKLRNPKYPKYHLYTSPKFQVLATLVLPPFQRRERNEIYAPRHQISNLTRTPIHHNHHLYPNTAHALHLYPNTAPKLHTHPKITACTSAIKTPRTQSAHPLLSSLASSFQSTNSNPTSKPGTTPLAAATPLLNPSSWNPYPNHAPAHHTPLCPWIRDMSFCACCAE